MNQANAVEYEIGTWQNYSETVRSINPKFAEVIDQLDPPQHLSLIKVRFPFGAAITQLGKLTLPESLVTKDLNYAPTPLTLQLQNCSEGYADAQGRIIPLKIFHPGDILGLYETVGALTNCAMTPYWNTVAGVRSVFLSPKASNGRGHGRLRKHFHMPHGAVTALEEQWHCLKDIINCPTTWKTPWHNEVLVFTKPWFAFTKTHTKWLPFYNYLLEQSWIQSKNMRINSTLSPYWNKYTRYLGERNYSPNAYIMNTLLHCLHIAHGATPGFGVLGSETNRRIPNERIEWAYHTIYGELKGAIPAVIGPCTQHQAQGKPLYYSLNYPTAINTAPEIKSRSNSHMNDLKQIQEYYQLLQDAFTDDNSKHQLFNGQQFRFYHPETDLPQNILSWETLLQDDPNICEICRRYPDHHFNLGPFFKGVIQIVPDNTEINA